MKNIIGIIFIFFSQIICAQNICKCPPDNISGNNSQANIVFKFKDGNQIGLCGNTDSNLTYSEFILFNCTTQEQIEEWGAMESCIVQQKK